MKIPKLYLRDPNHCLALAPNAPRNVIAKNANRYLKRTGWKMLEPATWANIWVRVQKDDVVLNLMVHENNGMGWPLLMTDASEAITKVGWIVGVLSASPIPYYVAEAATNAGVFALCIADLPIAAEIARGAANRMKERQRKSFEVT